MITLAISYFVYKKEDKRFEAKDYDGVFNGLKWILKEEKAVVKKPYDKSQTKTRTDREE